MAIFFFCTFALIANSCFSNLITVPRSDLDPDPDPASAGEQKYANGAESQVNVNKSVNTFISSPDG